MNARDIIEAETPKRVFKKVMTPERRIDMMRFRSKDEVEIGTKVLYRMTDYGFKGNVWDKVNDDYYRISGSDHYRVSSFWFTPPGRKFDPGWPSRQCPKEESTEVSLYGVCGATFTWDEFFKECIKPELYYPKLKKQGMAFDRPPNERYDD